MRKIKRNNTMLIGAAATLAFVLAVKVRHPILVVCAIVLIVITYHKFRANLIEYRRKQFQRRQRDSSIEVEATDVTRTERIAESKDKDV